MIVLIAFSSMGELYRTTVDADYGFYKVRNLNHQNATVLFENKTLTINDGDTVEWMSLTDPDEKLTIVSDEGLWGNTSGILPWSFKKYNYTFNDVGTYNVHLKQYPRLHQRIVVVANHSDLQGITGGGGGGISDGYYHVNSSEGNWTPIESTPQVTQQVTPQVTKESPGFGFILAFLIVSILYILKRR